MNQRSLADSPAASSARSPDGGAEWSGVGRDVPPGQIFGVIRTLLDSSRHVAVATVIEADGSTPRKVGARVVIDEDGQLHGTIGGGVVEAEALRRGLEAIQTQRASILECHMTGPGGPDAAPICGGIMRVVVAPASAQDREAYARAAQALERRERGLLLTRVRSADPTVVRVEWLDEPAIGTATAFPGPDRLADCFAGEEPCRFQDESAAEMAPDLVLVEPVVPRPRLLIVGGGHVGQAVAVQASWVGFDITVIDDRPEYTQPALFPAGTTRRCGEIAREVAGLPFDPDTYIVLVTRGHRHDAVALEACIHRPAAYLGMIGSERKVAMVKRDFLQNGKASPAEWARVFAPIGLDIGAQTVPEIAASVIAQLIAVRRGVPCEDRRPSFMLTS
jgi:xanthine dehydrogenase accessory factor